MGRKVFVSAIAALLFVSTFLFSSGSYVVEANTGEQLKKQMKELQEQQSQLKDEANKKKTELDVVEKEMESVHSEMKELDENIVKTSSDIEEKEEEISETQQSIQLLKDDISELEERIKERDELLKSRARHMYKNGGIVSYLEVIFGARSFGDLLERVNAVSQIARQDRKILEQHIEDKKAVEEAKDLLEEDLALLEEQREELEKLKSQLNAQLNEKQKLIVQLEDEYGELQELILSIEEEEKFAKAQEEAIAQELKRWEEEQRRIEEERRRAEEAKRKAEEEKRKSELVKRQKEQQGQQNQHLNSGKLFRPANGRITSSYGWRTHPIFGDQRFHNGIDFWRDGGRDIYAAADGTVTFVGENDGYGNVVIIAHVIDGQPLHTLYAHLESSDVSVGQRVSRGQRIATMGTTGNSTGIHLHFEVRIGENWGNATSQNPMNYF